MEDDEIDKMPPSFAPQGRKRRPSTQGAKRIGNTAANEVENPLNGGAENLLPPSYQPNYKSNHQSNYQPDHQPNYRPSYQPQKKREYAPDMMEAPIYPPRNSPHTPPSAPAQNRLLTNNSPRSALMQPAGGTPRHKNWLLSGRRALRTLALLLVGILIISAAWGIYLYQYGNRNLTHTSALSGAPDTPGDTYLIVGSDKRSGAYADESVEGQRSDTVMLLHKAPGADPVLLSLPRDTYVDIPEYGYNKLNAAYSLGEGALLVATVERLTGLTIDHYVEIGMEGVVSITDAVGTIPLCYDQDVNDPLSGLNWNAGCHSADGTTALAFARMRYEDPLGDIGRADRQRQVVSSLMKTALSKDLLFSPLRQKKLVGTTASALVVDEKDNLWQVGKAGLVLRKVMQGGIMGTPPIADLSYYPGGVGSTVLLDENLTPQFWEALRQGTLHAEDYETLVAHTADAADTADTAQ